MLEFYQKDSFASFHYKHAENPHLARWNENSDIPRDDRDRGGYNIDTIRMQNQHTVTGALLCPDTNTDAGLHYRATEFKTVLIHTELDVVVEYCTTPPLVKLFIALKKEEYAKKKIRASQNTAMRLSSNLSSNTPPRRRVINTIRVYYDPPEPRVEDEDPMGLIYGV
ncbi:hypothetical protein T492DRAFT_834711 [Pavlovales sp. CCMP2436]|nr:hypothetical protein T492DRAFT_834711 [Pavlovales sp. CCMP2436]